jgi:hypothetical protein
LSLEALEDRTLLSAILTVSNTNDSGAGSLRAAIATANQTSGDTIAFAPNLAGQTITLTSGELLNNSSMTITGLTNSSGTPNISISGNNQSRVFDVENGGSINIAFDNLTITGGLTVRGRSEQTGLFLEAACATTFIGSQTAGAIGDVTSLALPGGLTVGFTGHDVRHVDGRQPLPPGGDFCKTWPWA